jgi:phage shock protein PspC (stress-responsive transcriptional regulator)
MLRQLRRNMRYRWIGGVCSGLASFIGLDVFPIRMLFRIAFLALLPTTWWVYLLLWIFLPPQRLYEPEKIVVVKEVSRDKKAYLPSSAATKPKSAGYRPKVSVEIKRLEFNDIIERTEGNVSERVFQKVKSIDATVRSLMPQLSWWRTIRQPELATVKRSALEYFPQAVQAYLNLPRDYAENHRLKSGQTPEEKLLNDLDILANTLHKVMESMYHNDKVQVPEDLRRLSERFQEGGDPVDEIERTLDALIQRVNSRLPSDIVQKVVSIRASIQSLLPQLAHMGAGMTQEAYNVRQTATEYLPDALEKYLALPEGFAETHVLSNGKTAKATLLEQLELLDGTMKDLIGDLYQEDADALLIHGRFLKEKFADQKFTLPDSREAAHRFPDLKTPEQVRVDN